VSDIASKFSRSPSTTSAQMQSAFRNWAFGAMLICLRLEKHVWTGVLQILHNADDHFLICGG